MSELSGGESKGACIWLPLHWPPHARDKIKIGTR